MPKTAGIPAADEGYADFIIQYNKNIHGTAGYLSNRNFEIIDDNFAVLYVPLEETEGMPINSSSYNSIPKCYTYMDRENLNAAGITRLHDHPYLHLRGRGTAVAVIDSGIDYTHPAFRSGRRTRIAAIWDQTQPASGAGVPYGAEYGREQIQQALDSEDPLAVVPTADTDGHGTFLAGVAAGSDLLGEAFSGAAPEASIIVVKLKQAKRYLRELYLLPENAAAFQENDIMLGIRYAVRKAREQNLPLSICIGLGTSLGAHIGGSPLERYMNATTHYSQNVISVAAGNEGNTRNHYRGTTDGAETAAELRIGEREEGFVTELWGISPGKYAVRVQSPSGEIREITAARGRGRQMLSFVFAETRIEAYYVPIERESGATLCFFRFIRPASGIWRILVSGDRPQEMAFHLWLPVYPFISENTFFTEPTPYTTVTSPGNAADVITVTAYDYRNGSLYPAASRGYTVSETVKPELAAAGVEVTGPVRRSGFAKRSGTSAAAALTAGACALFFEWAIVRENAPHLNGTNAKNYLIRGANRMEGRIYPNREWGYGTLDLYRVFEELL